MAYCGRMLVPVLDVNSLKLLHSSDLGLPLLVISYPARPELFSAHRVVVCTDIVVGAGDSQVRRLSR
jgi:hypothetical protein